MGTAMITTKDTFEVDIARLEAVVSARLGRRVGDFRVLAQDGGLVLQGRARTYYAKQLAQHAVMDVTAARILANEIQVA
jgi:osmotically-inducible protein OsmY